MFGGTLDTAKVDAAKNPSLIVIVTDDQLKCVRSDAKESGSDS